MLRRCYAPNTLGDRKKRVVFGGAAVVVEGKGRMRAFKGDSDKFETASARSTRSERVSSKKKIEQQFD